LLRQQAQRASAFFLRLSKPKSTYHQLIVVDLSPRFKIIGCIVSIL
jgi:hypothetical protein